MIKGFPIDFIRQIFEQIMLEQHIKNEKFYGGKNQVNIFSFYEQLKNQDEIGRFVESYRDLSEQQNRSGLIMNGVLTAPENPTITNLYSTMIIPLEWTCAFRVALKDRDSAIETINNLIEELKGSKVDIAQLKATDDNGHKCYVPFMVGTIGHNDGIPQLKNGDFIGSAIGTIEVEQRLQELADKGLYDINNLFNQDQWYYAERYGKLTVFYCNGGNYVEIGDDGNYPDIIFPPQHESFEKYKVSLSFDAIRCDEPRTLNAEEYCEISFGGSATIVSNGVGLGNDLVKVAISKIGINAETPISFEDNGVYPNWFVEPLEMPSGNNANSNPIQLVSNKFINNSHTDSISLTLQYSFIYDKTNELLKQLFKYGRYGTQGITANDISPNMIFGIKEYWSSWGEVDIEEVKAKVYGDIDIENTESDTLTIGATFQVQGENN